MSVFSRKSIVSKALAFRQAQEEYGLVLQKVQEIRVCDSVTQILNTPDFIKGVTNLHGLVVPIVDLRIRLSRVCQPLTSLRSSSS
jgi:purine-binding chemotaxis protein CheW